MRLAGLLSSLLIGCAPGLPPPVTVPAPPEVAQGLRFLVYRAHNYQSDSLYHFHEAVTKAFREAGMEIVDEDSNSDEVFDLAIEEECEHQRADEPLRCSLSFELDDGEHISNSGNRIHARSFMARYRAVTSEYAPDPLERHGGPLRTCVQAWKQEVESRGFVPAGREREGEPVLVSDGVGVCGPRENDSDAREMFAAAAHLLVNKIVTCPGVVDLARLIKKSGLGARYKMEDLPGEKLLRLCEQAEMPVREQAVGTGAIHSYRDACELARKDPQIAASQDQMKQQQEAAAQAERRARCLAEAGDRKEQMSAACTDGCASRVDAQACLAASRACAAQATDDEESAICGEETRRCFDRSGVAEADLSACASRCVDRGIEERCR